VAEFAPCKNHRVQQLLNLGVARLCVREDLADVVNWPLHRQGMPFLHAFHDDHGADHLGGCGYVELQGLAVLRRREDRGAR
jgi:hypothetical protein